MPIVSPTLACADLLNLGSQLNMLAEAGASMVHLDIMDGHYVPNFCFDFNTVGVIAQKYSFTLDVHLMAEHPEQYLEQLQAAGADIVTFHLDATPFAIRLAREIKARGMKAGIALNPSQPVSLLNYVLEEADLILVMGVEPGFSGQTFIPSALKKIEELAKIRSDKGLSYLIEVDGGIDDVNTPECIKRECDILVSGAFGVFRGRKGVREDFLEYERLIKTAQRQMELSGMEV